MSRERFKTALQEQRRARAQTFEMRKVKNHLDERSRPLVRCQGSGREVNVDPGPSGIVVRCPVCDWAVETKPL
jgi:hypothetical protein